MNKFLIWSKKQAQGLKHEPSIRGIIQRNAKLYGRNHEHQEYGQNYEHVCSGRKSHAYVSYFELSFCCCEYFLCS